MEVKGKIKNGPESSTGNDEGDALGELITQVFRGDEAALESFQEAHEVPDSTDVGDHEDAKRIPISDQGVHGVIIEFLTKRAEDLFEKGP